LLGRLVPVVAAEDHAEGPAPQLFLQLVGADPFRRDRQRHTQPSPYSIVTMSPIDASNNTCVVPRATAGAWTTGATKPTPPWSSNTSSSTTPATSSRSPGSADDTHPFDAVFGYGASRNGPGGGQL